MQQADECQVRDTTMELMVSGNQFHVEGLSKAHIERVIKCKFPATGQTNRILDDVRGRHDEVKLQIRQRFDRPHNVHLAPSRMMEQHIRHLIQQQIRSYEWGLLVPMGIPENARSVRARFLDKPFQRYRSINVRHYRDARNLRSTLTLVHPAGDFLRKRSIATMARAIRDWSRRRPFMRSSTALVITTPVYHDGNRSTNAGGCHAR